MKTMKATTTGGLVLAMFLALAPASRAQDGSTVGDGGFSVGPRATYVNPKESNNGNKWFAGAQARVHMGPAMALEGSIDYYRHNYAVDTRVMVYPVQASLLAYLMPDAVVSPLLLVGVGWYHTRVESPLFRDTQQRFGLHVGGGLEARLNSALSLDGTYRYVWIEDVASRDQNALNKDYKDSGSMVTIALNLHF